VSWGAFTPWLLAVGLAEGVGGVDAILYPATVGLGRFTYYQCGSLGFVALMLVLCVVIVARRRYLGRRGLEDGAPALYATIAVLALLLVKTGAPSYHMLLPTVLAFTLCRVLPRWAYVVVTAGLSTTTALSMYGMGAYWLSAHPQWDVGVYDPDWWLTRVTIEAMSPPIVVTAAALVNTDVLAILLGFAVKRPVRGRRRLLAGRSQLPAAAAGQLAPGQQVRVRFSGSRSVRMLVPPGAVLRRGELTAVYVAAPQGGFVLKAVRLGADHGAAGVEVVAGLRPDDQVALDPVRAGLAGARAAR